MKRLIVLFAVATAAVGVFAGPRGCGPRHCPPPPPPHYHHHYHGDGWGRGGENFWPGFVGGVIGGAVAGAIVSQPAVVTQPVVTQPAVSQTVIVQQPAVVTQTAAAAPATQVQNVWVEGRYVDTVQANGSVVRTWQPGHYEQRTVVVQ